MLRLILIFFIFSTFNTLSSKNKKKPNFLFVLVDDQPHDAVGFSNRYPFLKTPNSLILYPPVTLNNVCDAVAVTLIAFDATLELSVTGLPIGIELSSVIFSFMYLGLIKHH